MCLVLSRCGFDLCAAEWSSSYTESLTSQLLSPPLYSRLSLLSGFVLPPSLLRRSDLHLNIVLFKLQSSNFCFVPFVPSFSNVFLYLSPPVPPVFCSAGIRAGDAVSLLHLHLHLSGKETVSRRGYLEAI